VIEIGAPNFNLKTVLDYSERKVKYRRKSVHKEKENGYFGRLLKNLRNAVNGN